jgi:hypothetical protein
MSALGQKQTSEQDWVMSALPPKADIADAMRTVRFVPIADIAHLLGASETIVVFSSTGAAGGAEIRL